MKALPGIILSRLLAQRHRALVMSDERCVVDMSVNRTSHAYLLLPFFRAGVATSSLSSTYAGASLRFFVYGKKLLMDERINPGRQRLTSCTSDHAI